MEIPDRPYLGLIIGITQHSLDVAPNRRALTRKRGFKCDMRGFFLARIGRPGNDEYVLEPIAPFKHHSYQNAAQVTGEAHEKINSSEAEQLMSTDPTPDKRKTLVAEFTAKTKGELFLYVNDAVLLWPGKIDLFYGNNSGTGILKVERVMPDGKSVRLDHQMSDRR